MTPLSVNPYSFFPKNAKIDDFYLQKHDGFGRNLKSLAPETNRGKDVEEPKARSITRMVPYWSPKIDHAWFFMFLHHFLMVSPFLPEFLVFR